MTKRILIVVSAAEKLPLKEGGFYQTGYYLSELAEPLAIFLKQKYQIDFVSPGGKKPSIDPNSLKVKNKNQLLKIVNSQKGLEKPQKLEALSQKDLSKYDGLFIPGGHAPMADLKDNQALGKILKYFHQQKKLTALICHAPIALLSAGKTYSGYKITCFPQSLERFLEITRFHGHLAYYIDQELKKMGLEIKNTLPPIPHTIRDRELLTGQDPYAAKKLGAEVVKILNSN